MTRQFRGLAELSKFQIRILEVLYPEKLEEPEDIPCYSGTDIQRELEDYSGRRVNTGQLYPNLDELHELGYIRKNELNSFTNFYSITLDTLNAFMDERSWREEQRKKESPRDPDREEFMDVDRLLEEGEVLPIT